MSSIEIEMSRDRSYLFEEPLKITADNCVIFGLGNKLKDSSGYPFDSHRPKVMISMPMGGLTDEEIEENYSTIKERLENNGFKVVDPIISESRFPIPNVKNNALWSLGESLKRMADCDAVFFEDGWDEAQGCQIEHMAAVKCGMLMMFAGSEE